MIYNPNQTALLNPEGVATGNISLQTIGQGKHHVRIYKSGTWKEYLSTSGSSADLTTWKNDIGSVNRLIYVPAFRVRAISIEGSSTTVYFDVASPNDQVPRIHVANFAAEISHPKWITRLYLADGDGDLCNVDAINLWG